jgi:hypothetical protein
MNSTLFLGTYPGLTQAMLSQEIKVIADFLEAQKESSKVAISMESGSL